MLHCPSIYPLKVAYAATAKSRIDSLFTIYNDMLESITKESEWLLTVPA